ncbi:polysaccharide pyruvyl transferase family protein [Neptunomonas phycophila]|uniref:polysaccharide pyruvyl transferase family protein n=1 Tax=Neptunomonas phycophila TaxID=1572645 RepID=UPI0030F7E7E1
MKFVIFNDTRTNKHHGCECVLNVIVHNLRARGGEILFTSPLNNAWWKDQKLKEAIEASDVVLINGEGTIHHGSKYGLWLLKAAEYAKEKNKKVFLINALWQDNPNSFYKYLSFIDCIYVRDSFSQIELAEHGYDSVLLSDLTFDENVSKYISHIESEIAITDSVFNILSTRLKRKAESSAFKFLPVVFLGQGVLGFIKFVFGGFGVKNIPNNFLSYLSYIFYKLSIIKDVSSNRSNYLECLSESSGVICARFHTLCFVLKLKKPFFVIESNSHKVKALLRDVGVFDERLFLSENSVLNDDFDFDLARNILLENDYNTKVDSYIEKSRGDIKKMFDGFFK